MKPRYLIVAYPELEKTDFEWVQSIRRKHDELSYRAIAPHFTLFFPCGDVGADEIMKNIEKNVSDFQAFNFVIRSALLMPPVDGGKYSYTFLVPDEGMSGLVQLHRRIYSSGLERTRRFDLPFVPHLTVGSSKNLMQCKKLVDEINESRPQIAGKIGELQLVIEDGDKISTVEMISLLPI
jgi:2'-5' RNA ligase